MSIANDICIDLCMTGNLDYDSREMVTLLLLPSQLALNSLTRAYATFVCQPALGGLNILNPPATAHHQGGATKVHVFTTSFLPYPINKAHHRNKPSRSNKRFPSSVARAATRDTPYMNRRTTSKVTQHTPTPPFINQCKIPPQPTHHSHPKVWGA